MLGDLNCDLLQPDKHSREGRDLLHFCDIFDLTCLVKEPTRITATSCTLINVILTNNRRRLLSTSTLEHQISDHRLIYAAMRASYTRKPPRKNICRSYKCYDKERFFSDLNTVPFHISLILDDINNQAWAFGKLFDEVVNEHALIRQFHTRGGQVPYNDS